MTALQISLFGRFDVRCGEEPLPGLGAAKVQELFCFLLLFRERPHPREKLAHLLWGDCTTAQSKTYLRKTLWQLQAALEAQPFLDRDPILLVVPGWVELNREARFWLDVALFEQAFARVQGVAGGTLDVGRARSLQQAVDLYGGDLLEGWYQEWCLYERERLQHLYLAMLDKLMAYCEVHGDYEAGLAHGSEILRYDCARERTHRRLMRLHYLNLDRTAALRQYERCVAALEGELGVGPAERTAELCQHIRCDRLVGLSQPRSEPRTSPEPAASQVPQVLGYLQRLHAVLADVQGQVEHEIATAKQVLNR
jgi:DNA-binding SARP family transcriptional activator